MNIGINLLPFRDKLGGAGNYAKNIVRELSLLDTENNYFLFVSRSGLGHFRTDNPKFELVVSSFNSSLFPVRIFWEQFVFPFQLRKRKIELLFTPSVAVPLLHFGRMATTVHDIAYKKLKKKYPALRRLYLAAITRLALRKSEIIFTVSNFSKEEIIKEYNIAKEKIIVTPNGIDDKFLKPVKDEVFAPLKEKYHLPEKYILYVGALEPGKNLESILRVFSYTLKEEGQSDLFLVLTGGMGWKKKKLFNLMRELSILDNILILPYIPDGELPVIYKLASVLIYISLYEGFGLPVLEGMASGIPVIASEIPPVKEFAGNSVSFINLHDQNSLKNKLYDLLCDSGKREYFIKKGMLAAEKYKWNEPARIIYSYFKEKRQKV